MRYMLVHGFFFQKLTVLDLVETNLDLLLEPLVVSQELGDGFLKQIVRCTPSSSGEVI